MTVTNGHASATAGHISYSPKPSQLLAPLLISLAAAAIVSRPGAAYPAETMRWSARR